MNCSYYLKNQDELYAALNNNNNNIIYIRSINIIGNGEQVELQTNSQKTFNMEKSLNVFYSDLSKFVTKYYFDFYKHKLHTDRLLPIILNKFTAFIRVQTKHPVAPRDGVYGFVNIFDICDFSYNENDCIIIHFKNGTTLKTYHGKLTIKLKLTNCKKVFDDVMKKRGFSSNDTLNNKYNEILAKLSKI